jgi:hypothetical protein
MEGPPLVCRECGGDMKEGKALQNVWTSGGRRGAPARRGDCIGPSRDAVFLPVHKCEDCGRSISDFGRLTLGPDGDLTGG